MMVACVAVCRSRRVVAYSSHQRRGKPVSLARKVVRLIPIMLATKIEHDHVCFRYMLRTYVVQARGRNLGRAIAPIGRNDVAPRQHQLNVNLTT
jgi:hypothetical protein